MRPRDTPGKRWQEKITENLQHPYLVSTQIATDIHLRYGPDSAMYKPRVSGGSHKDPPSPSSHLSWIPTAVERGKDRTEQIAKGIPTSFGSEPLIWSADTTRLGSDRTVRTKRHGIYVFPQRVTQQVNLM